MIEWQPAYAQRGEQRKHHRLGWLLRERSSSISGTAAVWPQRRSSYPIHPLCPFWAGAKGAAEGEWQPDWQHTKSTKCLHLLRRLREIGATRPRSFWGGIGGALSSSSTGGGLAPPASSVAGTAAGTVAERPQTKAIVFTQFWVHMDLLQRYLLQHLGWPPAVVKGNMMQPEKAEQLQRQAACQQGLWFCTWVLWVCTWAAGRDKLPPSILNPTEHPGYPG